MKLDALRGVAQGVTGRALKKVTGNIRSGLLGAKKCFLIFLIFLV